MITLALPRPRELQIGVSLAAAFFFATCIYCLTYQALVWAVTPDVARTVKVALQEWGIWLVFTPWAFRVFGALDERTRPREQLLAGALLAFVAALVPTLLDQLLGTRSIEASLAIFLPRYAATVLVLHLFWRAKVRTKAGASATTLPVAPAAATISAEAATPAPPATLLVSKGADQCLIRTEDIQVVSAADNYVEIRARDQQYLMRATLAQAQSLLPADRYVRIHRSHIVRVELIERIRTDRSSSGTVHLRGGVTLPISRSYRKRLLEQRPQFGMH
jgi:hypothetical protein